MLGIDPTQALEASKHPSGAAGLLVFPARARTARIGHATVIRGGGTVVTLTRDEYLERYGHLSIAEQYQALGLHPIGGGSGDKDEDLDSDDDDEGDDDEDDEEEDDEEDEEGDDEEDDDDPESSRSSSKSKSKAKTKPDDFAAITTQAQFDRRLKSRLARERRAITAAVMEKVDADREKNRAEAKLRKAGKFEDLIATKDNEIVELKKLEPELQAYREYFETHVETLLEGIPATVVKKLMPKGLSPLEQLEWIDEYRQASGVTTKKRRKRRDDDDEDDKSTDDTKTAGDTKTSTTSKARGNSRRQPAKGGDKVPTADELLKAARAKRGPRRF